MFAAASCYRSRLESKSMVIIGALSSGSVSLSPSMIAGGEGTWPCFYENCMLVQRRSFADNFDLPYKSKEEVRVDAALRASEQTTNVSMSSTRA